ncbi:uncharacterized protein TNCT_285411 [Trichonephila clavata]|uniref:Uncharacterized protein n=1 Tax=Trichonephila clavata TaxID=2740835 RepID=A0A8X6KMB4_TRICU|nr:uncharacterized protein TNCT_285411 [Trichonephila clavata]
MTSLAPKPMVARNRDDFYLLCSRLQTVCRDILFLMISQCSNLADTDNSSRVCELCLRLGLVQGVVNCKNFLTMCEMFDYRFPRDLKLIPYNAVLSRNSFSPLLLDSLKKPIEEFFRCKVISSTGERNIEIEFYVDMNDRHVNVSMDTVVRPKFNYPSFVVTQLGLHNNYVSLSPYQNGVELLGGKQYEITLKQMAMEECKYNLSLQEFGCIPFKVDYPHNDSVCKVCEYCFNMTSVESRCAKLLENYNQPCDYLSYDIKMKEKYVLIRKKVYTCVKAAILTRRCQTIHVDILFNDFEITTTSYKPKLENLELVSIIGSYMGIYLGISMASVSWLFEIPLSFAHRFLQRRRKKEKNMKNKHSFDKMRSRISVSHRFRKRTQVFKFDM